MQFRKRKILEMMLDESEKGESTKGRIRLRLIVEVVAVMMLPSTVLRVCLFTGNTGLDGPKDQRGSGR